MRSDMIRLIVVVAASCLTMSGAKAGFQVIDNGGFETGTFAGWTQSGNTGATSVDAFYAHTGGFGAKLGPVGTDGFLSQNVTGLTAGNSYDLTFFLQYNGSTPNDFSLIVDGVTLYSVVNGFTTPYTSITRTFIATSSTAGVTFGFRQDPSYHGLDDVSISGSTLGAATPLPPTLLAGFLGMGLLAGVRRFRRA